MFLKSLSTKNNSKTPLNGLKIIALLGVSSMLLTNGVIASELNTITKVSTTSTRTYAPARKVPAGYVKGNYKTVACPYYKTKKVVSPLANELSLQEAAEIAAQELFRLYDVKLNGQTLQMYYCPKADGHPSSWGISVKVTPEYRFDLDLDPSTGELTSLMCSGGPNIKNLSVSEDSKTLGNGISLAKKGIADPNAACAKVKTLITQKGFISEPIETIKYEESAYGTDCAVATPYSFIKHSFTITTTSKKSYDISTSQDLTTIVEFSKN